MSYQWGDSYRPGGDRNTNGYSNQRDSYRPSEYRGPSSSIYDRPPPPPSSDLPPLPRGPPPQRVFGAPAGDSWRPSDPTQGYAQANEFSYRNNGDAPKFPADGDSYRPGGGYGDGNRRPVRNGRGGRGFHKQARGGFRVATAERPLLRVQGTETVEQMLGIDQGGARFLNANDLSDTEEEMVESDPESEYEPANQLNGGPGSAKESRDNKMDDPKEPPSKRRALQADSKEGSSVPKWSNPDPYTVLPPVDDAQRKRKDVVKLIRKARVAPEKENTENEVSANNDFISFGLEDDDASEPKDASPPPGAPTGPRHPNQRSYNPTANGPPGTSSAQITSDTMGPPPGLPSSLPPKPESTSNGGGKAAGNDSLGSRKRTYDDEIKANPPAPRFPFKKGKGDKSNGSVSREWIPSANQNPTPWLIHSAARTENPGFRLHKEICDFYDFVKPQRFEQLVREDLLQRVDEVVRSELPSCRVHCFGSFAAGLYLPNSDMDLVIISNEFRDHGRKVTCQTNSSMHRFANFLRSTIAEQGSIETITGAKVPIIKFVDRITAIRVDISFENNTGIIANDTFSLWKGQFPAMPILVTIIKQFLMMRGLNEVSTGGLGGFSVTCLVTSLLQNMPRVQIGELIPEHHLGEMLIEFLDFYGNQLDISRTGISMNPPGYFDKTHFDRQRNKNVYRADRSNRLAIIDPNRADNDISGGSKNVALIFERLSAAHREIKEAFKNPKCSSLLDWMLGGDYDNFIWHRNRLRFVYENSRRIMDGKGGDTTVNPGGNPGDDVHVLAQPSFAHVPAAPSLGNSNLYGIQVPKSQKPKTQDASSAVPNEHGNKTAFKQKPRVEKKQRELAKKLKRDYPSIAKKIPTTIIPRQKKQLLDRNFKHMDAKDQKKHNKRKDKKNPRNVAAKGADVQGNPT
ncbi:MAG: hypothetical protein Q9191_007824 [Dirinaria sp. TL-2023a]